MDGSRLLLVIRQIGDATRSVGKIQKVEVEVAMVIWRTKGKWRVERAAEEVCDLANWNPPSPPLVM